MKTNKFIENSTKELLDRLKESFANKNVEYKESDQLALLRRISNIKMSICVAEIHIIKLLQQNAIDIEVLTNTTEKYNKLCEELDILNSYKTIFDIN
jgi:hypothetical protein